MNLSALYSLTLSLARQSQDFCAPNPPVGALIHRRGKLLAWGFHRGPGTPHAEAQALDLAQAQGLDLQGAEMLVTLEPCWQTYPGKLTPPCVPRILASGIAQVRVGAQDPNPRVQGGGIKALEAGGVRVHRFPQPFAQEAQGLLEEFQVWITQKRPFFHLKWAQSLDGRLADRRGTSQWLTGEPARTQAQALRAQVQGVLVGAGTLRRDNPRLTVRQVPGKSPKPLILAGKNPLPIESRVWESEASGAHLILKPQHPQADFWSRTLGDRVIWWDGQAWEALGQDLLGRGFYRVLVEGGPRVLNTWIRQGWWDRMTVFTAPVILGSGPGIRTSTGLFQDLLRFHQVRWSGAGADGRLDVYRVD